jgi:hypothetical protein
VAVGAVAGHYLLGTYGQIIRGADLGLLLALLSVGWAHRRLPSRMELILAPVALVFGPCLLFWNPTLMGLLLIPVLFAAVRRLA